MIDWGSKVLKHFWPVGLVLLLQSACEGSRSPRSKAADSDSDETSPPPETAPSGDLFAQRYCQAIGKVKLRQDLAAELSYYCKKDAATSKFLSLIKAAGEAPQGQTPVYTEQETVTEDYRSEFVYLWAFAVPIKPIDIKDRQISENLAKGFQSDKIRLTTKATALGPETLDPGLHLKSTALEYALDIQAPSGVKIENKRHTQFNIYQVGDTEMGFSEEHLTDTQNPDYSVSNMINLSIKDGRPGKDGNSTIVVSLLRINFFNRKSPDTARDTTQAISQYLADSLYQALK